MRHRWTRERFLSLVAVAALLVGLRPGDREAAAEPGKSEPSSELILLFSGEVQGNLQPCG